MDAYKGRILVVDDEAFLVNSLARAVRDEGFEADSASDGLAALDLLSENRYDVVVTDLRMPNMDGPELMGRIEDMSPAPQVIAITGYASLDAAVECLRKGAADFLVKPFGVDEFLESIRKVMARASTANHSDPDWDEVTRRYSLTRRQVEVLTAFFRTGKSNRELAEELFLSQHTVKSHLKAAFEKVGVSSRAQLLKVLRDSEG